MIVSKFGAGNVPLVPGGVFLVIPENKLSKTVGATTKGLEKQTHWGSLSVSRIESAVV